MHDPEKFQAQTIKAIADLQETFGQTLNRQLALGAMMKAILGRVPLAALPSVMEDYEADIDHLASQFHPKFQRPEFWSEWSDVIEARRKQLQQSQDHQTGAS